MAPICEVQGTRSEIWARIWAQNPVLKIRPSSGPAGWDKVCVPGVIRMLCQAKARVTVGMVSHAQARPVLCVVLCPSQRGRSLCKRAPFSSQNGATEAMTPPFCSISFRLHGLRTPRRQQLAETLELIDFHKVFAKTQKMLFDMFRSIFSNSEATLPAPLIAVHVFSSERLHSQ